MLMGKDTPPPDAPGDPIEHAHQRARASGERARNLTFAALLAPAGCLNVIIIIGALLLGLWLDSLAGVRGPFTIGLILISVPVGLFLMVRIALSAVRQITPPQPQIDEHRTASRKEE